MQSLIRTKRWLAQSRQAIHSVHLLLIVCSSCLFLSLPSTAQTTSPKWPDQMECRDLTSNPDIDPVLGGWCIAIDDRRGNCVACHTFNISPWPISLPTAGNLAPPMVAMKARFPDSAALRSVIEDASAFNPRSSMPPYLKHQILTPEDIDHVITFLETL